MERLGFELQDESPRRVSLGRRKTRRVMSSDVPSSTLGGWVFRFAFGIEILWRPNGLQPLPNMDTS